MSKIIGITVGTPFNPDKLGGGSSGGCDIEILREVNPTEEHTNEQVYGAKALDETFVAIDEVLQEKQAELVSGENIKTINGRSILGAGNIAIEGGNSPKVFERIATATVSLDENGDLPTTISITKDENGNPFELTDIYCEMLVGLTDGKDGKLRIATGNKSLLGNFNPFFTDVIRKWFFRYDNYGEGLGGLCTAPGTSILDTNIFPSGNVNSLFGQPVPPGKINVINNLQIIVNTGTAKTFVEGTTITLWGVRK